MDKIQQDIKKSEKFIGSLDKIKDIVCDNIFDNDDLTLLMRDRDRTGYKGQYKCNAYYFATKDEYAEPADAYDMSEKIIDQIIKQIKLLHTFHIKKKTVRTGTFFSVIIYFTDYEKDTSSGTHQYPFIQFDTYYLGKELNIQLFMDEIFTPEKYLDL